MAGIDAPNYASFYLSTPALISRNAEYAGGSPLTDTLGGGTYDDPYLGCNRAGSNAPGIGIATGLVNPKLSDWALLDQFGAAREPQNSQHIGGSGLGAGDDSSEAVKFIHGTDVNDQGYYVVADTAAFDGAVADSTTGTLNATGKRIAIGDILWGPNP